MSTGCQKTLCQYVKMQLFSLGIKMKVVQNVMRISERHYVNMSIMSVFQSVWTLNVTFQLRYHIESFSKCLEDIRTSLCQYVIYVSISICLNAECDFSAQVSNWRLFKILSGFQTVSMPLCQFVIIGVFLATKRGR